MKNFIVLVVVLCAMMISSTAWAARGTVFCYDDWSRKIVIELWNGFTCAEVNGFPRKLEVDDIIVGDLEGYGTHELYNLTKDESFSVWIDNYWLSKEKALEWFVRKY
ncbi:MAG: hypothetical protein IJK81_11745 [Selenomonadaceae bacterium]|nr:hypothetical protein [Selenomonadaceae bacterium]